jgi:hypothetical protein
MRHVSAQSSIAVASALALTVLGTAAVGAQDAESEETTDAMVVDCTHEPRVLADMMELFGEVAAEGAGEAASLERQDAALLELEPAALPEGAPADEETAAAATHAVAHLVACFNAGDLLAGWGGVSDDFLTSQMDTSIFDEDFVAQIEAGPVALAEEFQTRIFDFEDVIAYDDGRVGVLFHYHGPASPGEGIEGVETDLFIVENNDGVWQLDEVIADLEAHYGPEA